MKIYSIAIMVLLFLSSCTKKDDGDTNIASGLVSFKEKPVYLNDNLQFKAQIQFAAQGKVVEIEYQVLYNNAQIASGSAPASVSDGIINMFFETSKISVSISKTTYSGKKLYVILDPNLKVTSAEYKSDAYMAFRKEEITIP